MSELIDNSADRKRKLKELILKLHRGVPEEEVKKELLSALSTIPYGEVVEVEQELIGEGLPEEEVLRLCDAHSSVLKGHVDLSAAKKIPPGHPVDIMINENREIKKVAGEIEKAIADIGRDGKKDLSLKVLRLHGLFNNLMDVDKHYQRKEYLIFPYLEKKGITGPPKVMWGKHDEIRELLKGSIEVLKTGNLEAGEIMASAEILMLPAVKGVVEMTVKEEEILFPMCLDNLSDAEWNEVNRQSPEFGFCLYDPPVEWKPAKDVADDKSETVSGSGKIQLPTGSFTTEELTELLNLLPVDITFVDRNDRVKYFSNPKDRIFQRNRAILNRDVRHCHPPASAHIVDRIIEDFKNGKASSAPFWINMGGKMIHIEYFAVRNEKGEYLGTLEVSHDISGYRKLEGEQRILSYKH